MRTIQEDFEIFFNRANVVIEVGKLETRSPELRKELCKAIAEKMGYPVDDAFVFYMVVEAILWERSKQERFNLEHEATGRN